jgi:uncharacterized protein with von Willebrand factor type A (vWA) domain
MSMAERKVVTRPWRIEVLFSERWGWCVQSTVSTEERAIEELAYYRRWHSRPVRAKNRETGEVIGADALDQIDTEMGGER